MPELQVNGGVAACGHGVELRHREVVAIARSDFTVPSGRFVTLIGPNGSGKSTLMSSIAGIHEPSAGRVEVLGTTPGEARPRVAFVPQSTRVNDALPVTVREVVAMGRYASLGMIRRFRRPDHEAVRRAISRLDIADLAGRHLPELSGGQRQRVFVAQGLAQERDMLLLDEPISALDIPAANVIRSVIAEEREAGRTVVVTTHDLAEAAASDHVILLSGRVVAEGPPAEVLVAPLLSEAYATKIVEMDGTLVFDDPAHIATTPRHIHVDRRTGTHAHDDDDEPGA